MTWTPNIPAANQTLANSQPLIRDNFTEVFTDFGKNHVGFTNATVADRGKHNFVTLKVQAADPVIANNNEAEIFTKQIGGITQLFWKRFNGSAVQMTAVDPVYTPGVGPVFDNKGFTFLPGGLLLQYGNLVVNNATRTPVVFPTAFSAPPYTIQVAMGRHNSDNPKQVYVWDQAPFTPTAANFNVYYTTGTEPTHIVYWLAIGPA